MCGVGEVLRVYVCVCVCVLWVCVFFFFCWDPNQATCIPQTRLINALLLSHVPVHVAAFIDDKMEFQVEEGDQPCRVPESSSRLSSQPNILLVRGRPGL